MLDQEEGSAQLCPGIAAVTNEQHLENTGNVEGVTEIDRQTFTHHRSGVCVEP